MSKWYINVRISVQSLASMERMWLVLGGLVFPLYSQGKRACVHVCVGGGGTGWLVSLSLAKSLDSANPDSVTDPESKQAKVSSGLYMGPQRHTRETVWNKVWNKVKERHFVGSE